MKALATKKLLAPSPPARLASGLFLFAVLLLTALGPATASEPAESAADAAAEESYEWFYPEDKPLYRYRIGKIAKVEKAYRIMEGNRVRFPGGSVLEYVEHDDEWFYVKVYEKIEAEDARVEAETKPEPEPEPEPEPAFAPGEVDRLRFEPYDEGLPKLGQWRNGFDVGDMNGDGHPDIVFGPARKSVPRPNIFLGDGAGNWTFWRATWPAGQPFDYGDVAVGDLNGDGHLDIVFGIHLRGMLAFVGDGAGTFTLWSEGIEVDFPGRGGAALSFSARGLDLVDWNGDGKLDIMALGEGPKGMTTRKKKRRPAGFVDTSRGFLVYLNQGDGSWKPHRPTTLDERLNFGDDFAVVDFDADGRLDLLSSSMRMGSEYLVYAGEEPKEAYPVELPEKTLVRSVEATDLDGDGDVDILLGALHPDDADWRTSLLVYRTGDELGWSDGVEIRGEPSRKGVTAMASGDLDGDGHVDLVALTGAYEVWVLLGDGEGGFELEKSPELPHRPTEGCTGADVHLHDLDGDGRLEIVASFAGEPTGLVGLEGMSFPGCPGQGRIHAWKIASEAVAPSTP